MELVDQLKCTSTNGPHGNLSYFGQIFNEVKLQGTKPFDFEF